jgi:hypothetical protein
MKQGMIRIEENNLQIRFLNHGLVYIVLYKGSHLSHQLLREIRVISKVTCGVTPAGYIINVEDSDSSELFKEVYKKSGRMDVPVAIIVKKPMTTLIRLSSRSGPTHVLGSFRKAVKWMKVACSINLPDYSERTSIVNYHTETADSSSKHSLMRAV